jgi:hypothetical protein
MPVITKPSDTLRIEAPAYSLIINASRVLEVWRDLARLRAVEDRHGELIAACEQVAERLAAMAEGELNGDVPRGSDCVELRRLLLEAATKARGH